MFQSVQKKLTLLFTALTGAILLFFLGLLFFWNIRSKEQEQLSVFQNLWQSVSSRVQGDLFISSAYLAQTETEYRSVLHIEDNGSPFLFSGAYSPLTDRDTLIKRGISMAERENVNPNIPPVSSSISQTNLFIVHGDRGDTYHGKLAVMATGKGAKSLLLLTYVTPRKALISQALFPYIFLGGAGILLLAFVSWFLTGQALSPARQAAREQIEFIAAASHELRSPLAVIRSSLSAIKGELSSHAPSVPLRLLSNTDRECERMARLVSDMLLLNSLGNKSWSLQRQNLEMDTLMIGVYESHLPLCREKSVNLLLELPETPLPVFFADKQRLEQILSILLDNALTYTPSGKSVTLSISTFQLKKTGRETGSRTGLELRVSDQGPGIPDNKKAHIFDRFYRADPSRNDKKHFGLGLSIAKELTNLHGGTLSVHDAPGGGSCFIVKLPPPSRCKQLPTGRNIF